jgi:hypothetical protein
MRITYQHRFDAPIERVIAMLRDEGFARERARAAGAADADVVIDAADDGAFSVAIRRAVPASSIPSEFRSLVGSNLVVRYTEAWTAPAADVVGREGTFAVEVIGAPGHARGSLVLNPSGETTAFGLAGELEAKVPLVGAMVEKTVAAAIEKSLPLELAAADEWLASHA